MPQALPDDVTYPGLTPAQVAFLQSTVQLDAQQKGFAATIATAPEPGGLMTATVHYAEAGAEAGAEAAPAGVAAIDFAVGGAALTQAEMDAVLQDLGGLEPELVWALIRQESETLTGFLPDRRPVILFERHVFAARTQARFSATHPDISGPRYTTYGTLADQYVRLQQALALDVTGALEACSWGLGQVMGEHAQHLGYADAVAMVDAVIRSEGAQLQAVAAFLKRHDLVEPLAAKNWEAFATRYNGGANPAYASELEAHYAYYRAGRLPDLTVRAVQLYLGYLHYPVGVDGVFGSHTRDAVARFQVLAGISPADGEITPATSAALQRAVFG